MYLIYSFTFVGGYETSSLYQKYHKISILCYFEIHKPQLSLQKINIYISSHTFFISTFISILSVDGIDIISDESNVNIYIAIQIFNISNIFEGY